LNALMNIGTMCGAPFLTFSDHIGRRGINFTGNAIVIVAAILQGCATNMPTFMAGRFILGFGSAIMSSPQYMAEVSPAHYRGRLVGLFGACFQIGSLGMTAGFIGFSKMEKSNLAWRIPVLLEALFPAIVCLTIYFLTPESPRYLVMKGKIAQARRVIARYQTNSDDENSELVNAVIVQIEDSLEQDRVVNRQWWNFLVFFTKPVRYRLLILVLYSVFQQWNGGGIITTYLVPALETVGITNPTDIAGINFGLTGVYCVFTVAGAFLVDIVSRRNLIFAGLISFIILQTAATITGWR
jgi:MFS family permease